jgi:hypothetical protein
MRTSSCLLLAFLLQLPVAASAMWTFGAPPSGCEDLDGIAPVADVDFESDIQPLLDTCTGCHGEGGSAGLDLRPGQSYDNLVGVLSNSNPDRLRVEPFNPDDSSLLLAVNCQNPGGPGFQMGNLALDDRALIRDWIAEGAHPEPFSPEIPGDVTLEQVFSTSTFSGALGLVHSNDWSNRMFVVQQAGAIRVFEEPGTHELFMDISGRLTSGTSERGLLGLAFHPRFAENGLFYVNYSAGSGHPSGAAFGDTVVSEFQIDPATGLGDPDSERVLMTVVQDFTNHNGGNIKFGPDGYLYIGMGDGGSGGDPCNRSQTLDPDDIQTGGSCRNDPTAAMLGKMLRIDVDNTTPEGDNNLCAANPDGTAEYAVPADNPFVGEAACAEVWSLGLRNPWRWSFDRVTGDQWIADVGQNQWEEVNLESASHPGGANYGWNECEGPFTYPAQTPPQECPFEHDFPILHYPISGQPECSITGGYRYRGPIESLEGAYIYGDYCSGRIWFAWQVGPNEFEELEFSVEGFDLRSFGEDQQGNVYVVRSGGIWRFDGDRDAAPQLSAIDPDSGPATGGITVELTGQDFASGADVYFGIQPCTSVNVVDATTLTCLAPAGDPGTTDVVVQNPDGQFVVLEDAFTWLAAPEISSIDPDHGPETQETPVTISGSDFQPGAQVSIGESACLNIEVVGTDSITCDVPPGNPGTVDVTVTNPDDQSATLPAAFTWIAAPVIATVTPDSGPADGGHGHRDRRPAFRRGRGSHGRRCGLRVSRSRFFGLDQLHHATRGGRRRRRHGHQSRLADHDPGRGLHLHCRPGHQQRASRQRPAVGWHGTADQRIRFRSRCQCRNW